MDTVIIDTLKKSNLCDGLTSDQMAALAKSGYIKSVRFERNEVLFWTDKPPQSLYVLIDGDIAMAKNTASGKRLLSASNTVPGDLIGEVRQFSEKQMLWDYAVALHTSRLLAIDSSIFAGAGHVAADIERILLRNVISVVVKKLEMLGQKVRALSMPSVRERIVFYLIRIQDSDRRMIIDETREEIADFLGVARPSLSRELGRMQDEGILRLEGKEVIIADQKTFDELLN